MNTCPSLVKAAIVVIICSSFSMASAMDTDAAKSLAKRNNCFKCHAVDKAKDGPAYQTIAGKYRDDADAENKLLEHLTSGHLVVFPDGHEEEHKIVKTIPAKDTEQVKNLVQWVLSH